MSDVAGRQSDTVEPKGAVEQIRIAPDAKPAPMQSVEEVEAIPGRGLRGDRYFFGTGSHDKRDDILRSDVTLIQAEAIEAATANSELTIEPGETRRNITTRDVPLNHLVDREFWVGEVRLQGVKLCEPCKPIAEWIGDDQVIPELTHQGGLHADIVEGGVMETGDRIQY